MEGLTCSAKKVKLGGAGNMAAAQPVMLPDKLSHIKYRAALKRGKRKKRGPALARGEAGALPEAAEEEAESSIEQEEETEAKTTRGAVAAGARARDEFRTEKEKAAAANRLGDQERK